VISDSKQSFFAWLFYDSAALLSYCPDSVHPPVPEICRWIPGNTVPLIQCSRISDSLGGEITDVIASAYLFAVSGAVEASF
jgi:hypothetical protein